MSHTQKSIPNTVARMLSLAVLRGWSHIDFHPPVGIKACLNSLMLVLYLTIVPSKGCW